ncbi:thioredoxin family protein [Algivirga pacifica]|uniref:Spermatogenesis-associated protein 20-like TRX domain-containing protein n=1 Tax=Algivirga pacifica TaxID=1162670 RepID=A0ABP9DC64_9BACT
MKKIALLILLIWGLGPILYAQNSANIQWLDITQLEEAMAKEPRKVIIDVYTDWCGWCKKMDKVTFQDPEVTNYINDHYYAVKFNAEDKRDLDFMGYVFKFVPSGRRGYNELAASLLNNKLSYPTVVFLNEKLELIQPIPGFHPKERMHMILSYMEEGKDTIPWQDYPKVYKSPY